MQQAGGAGTQPLPPHAPVCIPHAAATRSTPHSQQPRAAAHAATEPHLPQWLVYHARGLAARSEHLRVARGHGAVEAPVPRSGADNGYRGERLRALRHAAASAMPGLGGGRGRGSGGSSELKVSRRSRSWPSVAAGRSASHSEYCNKIMSINETRPASAYELQLQTSLQARLWEGGARSRGTGDGGAGGQARHRVSARAQPARTAEVRVVDPPAAPEPEPEPVAPGGDRIISGGAKVLVRVGPSLSPSHARPACTQA